MNSYSVCIGSRSNNRAENAAPVAILKEQKKVGNESSRVGEARWKDAIHTNQVVKFRILQPFIQRMNGMPTIMAVSYYSQLSLQSLAKLPER